MRLILGPPASGKSSLIMKEFNACRESGGHPWLVVPTRILKDRLEMELATRYSGLLGQFILTFNDLLNWVIDHRRSGVAVQRITDFESFLIIRQLISDNRKKFHYFKDIDSTPGLVRLIYTLVMELHQTSGLIPENVTGHIVPKWQDLTLILRMYEDKLEEKQLYDSTRLHSLGASLTAEEFIPEFDALFLDGFYDFTSLQETFLFSVFKQCENKSIPVSMALPFTNIQVITKSRERLLSAFNWEIVRLQDAGSISRIADAIIEGKEYSGSFDVTRITSFGKFREVEHIANQIHFLVKEQGYLYSEIGVLSIDPDIYSPIIRSLFQDYRIPYYPSRDELLRKNPVIIFVRTLMRMAWEGIDNTGILSLSHSSYLEGDRFHNLRRITQFFPEYIRGDAEVWRNLLQKRRQEYEWERNNLEQGKFSHFDNLEEWAKADKEFSVLTRDLEDLLSHIFIFNKNDLISTEDFVSWLAGLIRILVIRGSTPVEDPVLASKDYMALRKLKESLQSMRKSLQILELKALRLDEYLELFDELIRDVRYRYRFYNPDAVQFLTPYDSRELHFKAVFILGLNEGEFPGNLSYSLSDNHERREMNRQAGKMILEDDESRLSSQILEFYTALTRSTQKLYVCFTPFDERGKQVLPSIYLQGLLSRCQGFENIPELQSTDTDFSSLLFRIVPGSDWMNIHFGPAFLQYDAHHLAAKDFKIYGESYPMVETAQRMAAYTLHRDKVEDYFSELTDNLPPLIYEGALGLDEEGSHDPMISARINNTLDSMIWSASRIERAGNCRYAFFLQDILKIKPQIPPKEEIKSDLKGLFYHQVLQIYVEKTRGHSQEELPDLVSLEESMEEAAQIMKDRVGDNRLFPLEWVHYRKVLRAFVVREKQFREGAEIVETEALIDNAVLDLGGQKLVIRGRIDRLDLRGGRLTVTDYKSSSVNTRGLKYFLRPLVVCQGIIYAQIQGQAVDDIVYLSIEKEENLGLIAALNDVQYEALWEQKSAELKALLGLLRDGNYIPWNSTQDMEGNLLNFYEHKKMKNMEFEWREKCQYCDFHIVCPRRDKKLRAW